MPESNRVAAKRKKVRTGLRSLGSSGSRGVRPDCLFVWFTAASRATWRTALKRIDIRTLTGMLSQVAIAPVRSRRLFHPDHAPPFTSVAALRVRACASPAMAGAAPAPASRRGVACCTPRPPQPTTTRRASHPRRGLSPNNFIDRLTSGRILEVAMGRLRTGTAPPITATFPARDTRCGWLRSQSRQPAAT